MIGRIKGGNNKNKFIFIAIDHYTKWLETKVLENKSSIKTVEAIEELIIKRHGIPSKILTDNGLEFKNSYIDALTRKYNIEWQYNSPGHHETVGVAERVNKTFMAKLRKLCGFKRESWELYVEKATDAVNFSFNRSIQTSPFIFKRGELPLHEIDKKLGKSQVLVSKTYSSNKRD